jgi:hypothetical protein
VKLHENNFKSVQFFYTPCIVEAEYFLEGCISKEVRITPARLYVINDLYSAFTLSAHQLFFSTTGRLIYYNMLLYLFLPRRYRVNCINVIVSR